MKKLLLFSIIFSLILNVSCLAQALEETVAGNNRFAFELYKQVYTENANVFFSPYSISSALGMTYAGAKNETARQMSQVLHFNLDQMQTHQGFSAINAKLERFNTDTTAQLSIANALWKSGIPFKQGFFDLTKKYYKAEVKPLDGAAQINSWIAKATKNKITKLVTDADLINADLVLTNAIYFKGNWVKNFNTKDTKKAVFTTLQNKTDSVDMMFQQGVFNYAEDDENQVLELPYQGGVSMFIILPKVNSSVTQLAKTINEHTLENLAPNFRQREIQVYLPKFKTSTQFELKEVLTKMGMPIAFTDHSDFAGIAEDNLHITKVLHKTFIEVNEQGTTAAAATAVVMVGKAIRKEPIFNVNRPFMVIIKDNATNSILFMGNVLNFNKTPIARF